MSFPSSAALPQPAALAAWLRRLFGRGAAAQLAPRPPFDALHGVDTAGLIYAAGLPTGHPHDRHNEGYYATAPSLFAGAIAHWRQTLVGCSPQDYAFIDLGCGKGRVLLLASELPFRSVVGIELDPQLARIAHRNVHRWLRRPRACRRITVERGDVLDLQLPAGPVVLFLFNSFSADVLAPLMERLAAAARQRSAPIDLIYVHPDHDRLIARTPGVEILRRAEVPFSQEDVAADVFGVSSDCFYLYRFLTRSRTIRMEL
ncbi:MAG TPA: class I SAM-dependent methyltransferase [Terracidiphilus sp.]|jgi:SAM-dependent methyltransferase|nr:class I SAM-dependent methyltransferase [Terracidiphilus sp.]